VFLLPVDVGREHQPPQRNGRYGKWRRLRQTISTSRICASPL
jgi:hypothetical protein